MRAKLGRNRGATNNQVYVLALFPSFLQLQGLCRMSGRRRPGRLSSLLEGCCVLHSRQYLLNRWRKEEVPGYARMPTGRWGLSCHYWKRAYHPKALA